VIARRWVGWALVVAAALVVPDPAVQPASISLTTVETAHSVDVREGVTWVLALGSDARAGTEVVDGNTDAIQLIGIAPRTGHAVGIGVPRDSWVSLPDGLDRINAALQQGGPELAAQAVGDLVGITPDLVLVTGFDGFEAMIGALDGVEVVSPTAYRLDDVDLDIRRGSNELDPAQALDFARSRDVAGGDFARSAHHQQLLLGVLRELRDRADEPGLMESATLSAIGGLETDLSPGQLYRLAQALTLVEPRLVTSCVIGGTPFTTSGGAQVIDPDVEQARALGRDARDDAHLQGGCRDQL
jgi:LCP family protein required for cell wall assembly